MIYVRIIVNIFIKKIPSIFNLFYFLLLLIFILQTNNLKCEPTFLWSKYYGNDEYIYISESITQSLDSKYILISGTYSSVDETDNAKYFIWKLDSEGRIIQEITYYFSDFASIVYEIAKDNISKIHFDELPEIKKRYNLFHKYVKSINILDNGDITLVVDITPNNPFIIVIDEDGSIYNAIKLNKSNKNIVINKVIKIYNDKFIFLGNEYNKPILIMVNINDKTSWEKVYSNFANAIFEDGLLYNDETLFLIGFLNTENINEERECISKLLLAKTNLNGQVLKDKMLNGRFGRIIKNGENNVNIIYDKSNDFTNDIWNMEINNDFDILSDNFIMKTEIFGLNYGIQNYNSRDVILALTDSFKFHITLINELNLITWSYIDDNEENRHWYYNNMISSKDYIYTLSYVYGKNGKNFKIGVKKFLK